MPDHVDHPVQQEPGFWPRLARSLPLTFILALIVLLIDYVTGPFIQFPLLFIMPVALGAWFHGRRWGIAFAMALPAAHAALMLSQSSPWTIRSTAINAAIKLVVLVLFAILTDLAAQRQRLADEVRVLRGLLPICAYCKQIRNVDGKWEVLEKYIAERTEAEFTHGICANCARKHFGVDPKE